MDRLDELLTASKRLISRNHGDLLAFVQVEDARARNEEMRRTKRRLDAQVDAHWRSRCGDNYKPPEDDEMGNSFFNAGVIISDKESLQQFLTGDESESQAMGDQNGQAQPPQPPSTQPPSTQPPSTQAEDLQEQLDNLRHKPEDEPPPWMRPQPSPPPAPAIDVAAIWKSVPTWMKVMGGALLLLSGTGAGAAVWNLLKAPPSYEAEIQFNGGAIREAMKRVQTSTQNEIDETLTLPPEF